MHSHTIERHRHDHAFLGAAHASNERRTIAVVALTAAMMLVEIVGGSWFGSMALVADGWHMSTHVAALGIAALAYRYARMHRHDSRFSFGTGKLGELAGFGSAIVLAMIALFIGWQSASRLLTPVPIAFGEAIPIAVLGLAVNVASALLLQGSHHGHGEAAHGHSMSEHAVPGGDRIFHDFGHHHAHHHGADGDDSNFRAAYVHVLADALTSVLAIAALAAGRFLGWTWLDPVMGLVGTIVIAAWAVSLVRGAGAVLLDVVPSPALAGRIRAAIEVEGDRVSDLHLWRLGPGHVGVILAIVSDRPREPSLYKRRLAKIEGLSHMTIEVNRCTRGHAMAA